jgi:hypothetical protein
MSSREAPTRAVGAELSDTLVADCGAQLGNAPSRSITLISNLARAVHCGAYDGVVSPRQV